MGIGIDRLSVAYDGQPVIDGLSLSIERGSLFTLLGRPFTGCVWLVRKLRSRDKSQVRPYVFLFLAIVVALALSARQAHAAAVGMNVSRIRTGLAPS